MMNIDIERLIDAVAACNEAYNEYCYSSKTLYRGPFEEITTRKNHVNYAREVHDREQNAVDTLAEVFQMDAETRNRLYIAARAVNRWRNDTRKAEVVRSAMVGGTYYAAVKVTILSTGETETFAAVVLTHTNSRDYFNFGVKTMGESSGPCEDHCPASILSLLSPTDSEYANNWRERCRKNIEAKKDPHALKNLPVGAVIRFTLHTGESIELLKHAAAYQFKRPFWFCQSSGRYMPATRIPANYEVVTA